MRPAAALLVLLATLSLVGASGAGDVDWKHYRYFDYDGGQLFVATDGSWDGARVVPAGYSKPPAAPSPWTHRLTRNYVWAPTCGSSAQSVSLAKTIETPGDPIAGNVWLSYGPGIAHPYHSAVARVNGAEIASLGDTSRPGSRTPYYFNGHIPAAALKRFHGGANRLTLHVVKSALPRGARCNARDHHVGVWLEVWLTFRSDVRALPSLKGAQQTAGLTAGGTSGLNGTIRFSNPGPSDSPEGQILIRTSVQGGVVQGVPLVHGGDKVSCTQTALAVLLVYAVTCRYTDFRVGQTLAIPVLLAVKAAAGFDARTVTFADIDWEIEPRWGDPNGLDNYGKHRLVLCGPAVPTASCK